ncbi:hypothetical protein SEPCBS119000_003944 [Sporothrix epigloea]|uniref:Uncharacterized protein n=1 Tax=Sporothrix epigloea TaxID=1892477 RepID=A0ABP0DPE0_9PEZI
MAIRPPRGNILCLRCEFRLFNSPFRRHLSRSTAPSALLPIPRPTSSRTQQLSRSAAQRSKHAAAYIHSGRPRYARAEQQEKAENEDVNDSLLSEADFEPLGETVSAADAEEIWNSLLGAEGEVTQDEVFGYIDEMRPTDEPILPEAVFNKAARDLADSFTVAQLHAYIRKYRKPTTQPTVYAWEVQRQPWMPDAYGDDAVGVAKLKAIGPGSSHLLKGYVRSSMTNKERVIIQLMRECWGVSMWEVMESPGQLEITVREVEFALLTAGAQTWLRDISKAYSTVTTTTAMASRSRSRSHSRSQTRLHRHIELVPGQRKLRVFAPASTADAILAEINATLCEATTKRFKLATLLRPEALAAATSPAMMRAVGTLTGSWVRLSSEEGEGDSSGESAPELLVSWVAPADRDLDLEDTGDMVFRMLLRAFGPARLPAARATAMLDYVPLRNSKAQFLADMDDNSRDAWPWEHRQGRWARLIESLPQVSSTFRSRAEEATTVPNESALPMDFTFPPSPQDTHSSGWYESSRTSTVATFGRVLHSQASEPTEPLMSLADADASVAIADMHRILSPTAPPLLGMALLPDGSAAISAATSARALVAPSTCTNIILRFLPDPKSPLAHRAPHIEVLLDVEQDQPPTLAGLYAITATSTADVLFPSQVVDARITQKQYYAFSGAEIATVNNAESASPDEQSVLSPLFHFLGRSHLQLMTGKQGLDILATPIRLPKLGLPCGVLLPAGPETHEEKPETVVTIGYVFAGLEVRRRVATAFEGWQAVLSSVEAGRGDGRWTELSLEAVPAVGSAASGGAQFTGSKASFLQAVGHMVHGDRVQWLMPSEVANPMKRI